MTRFRLSRAAPSKYITPEGAAALRRELEHLWRTKRPAVTAAVAEAAAQGDRSENAEYIYGKKQLAEIDRRIRHLRKRLDGMTVVDRQPSDVTKIYFGAWFELRGPGGPASRYRLVGPDEAALQDGYVSMDSPLGRAVMGRAAGDRVTVRVPDGEHHYEVVLVQYAGSSALEP